MEIEELPPVIDAQAPPFEFSPGHDSEPALIRQGYGDVDAVFRTAAHVVALELAIGRHSGVPLETRGVIGLYNAARGVLEMHGAAKVPHRNQELISRMLGLAPSAVQVYESHVGGGFGIRGEIYPEDVLVCVAAMRLKRPVKWIEDRREHLIAANHSRQQLHKIRAAVDDDGVILAIDDVYFHDQGAYVRTHATRVVHMTAGILPGPYRVPAYRSVGHFRLTNKTPAATYRAPGRYETTFVRERLVDAIAQSSASTASRCAGAMPSVRRRCLICGRSKRWAKKSTWIPAIISGCSTNKLPRSTGKSSMPTCKSARTPANWSASASPCSSRKAGWVRPTA